MMSAISAGHVARRGGWKCEFVINVMVAIITVVHSALDQTSHPGPVLFIRITTFSIICTAEMLRRRRKKKQLYLPEAEL